MAHPLPESLALKLERHLQLDWHNHLHRHIQRAALAVSLGLHGLRGGEVANLRVRDLDRTSSTIRVRTLKGGTPRHIPLNPHLADALWSHAPAYRERNHPLLPTQTGHRMDERQIWRYANAILKKYIGVYTFHSLRHTAAVRLWTATHDITAVQQLLGHRSLAQTHVYLQEITPTLDAGLPQWHRHFAKPCLKLFHA